jgi:hypothetical protein
VTASKGTGSYKLLPTRGHLLQQCVRFCDVGLPTRNNYDKENRMTRFIRALACGALVSSLAACVVQQQQPAPPPPPNPHEVAVQRFNQVNGRIDNLSRRIDNHVNQGFYPPPQGGALHHRLDVVRQEAHDMAAQHGGGLSGEEQRVLNQELDNAQHAIDQ